MTRLFIFLLISLNQFCFAQSENTYKKEETGFFKADSSRIDSNEISRFSTNLKTKRLTFGINHEFLNGTPGILISNGLDEYPLIHFEDLSSDILYKIAGQSDFKDDYSLSGNLSWLYPYQRIYLLSAEYTRKDFPSISLNHSNINLSAEIGLDYISLLTKVGYQVLNEKRNFGAEAGIQKNFYPRLYFGFLAGYYVNYFTYTAFFQSFIIKENVSLRLAYNKIEKYDFLNAGLNFTFRR